MTFEALAQSFDRYNVARKAAERLDENPPMLGAKCEQDAHARKVQRLGEQARIALAAYVKELHPPKKRSGPTMESLVNQLMFRLALALGVPTRNVYAEARHGRNQRDRYVKEAGELLCRLIVQAVAEEIESNGRHDAALANLQTDDRTTQEGRASAESKPCTSRQNSSRGPAA